MDPLLHRVEALPKRGSYAVTFVLPDGQERSVVAQSTGGEIALPAANLFDGWSADSASLRAALAAVAAVHEARVLAGAGRVLLLDTEGGWDVSIGNVMLSPGGRPMCVAHGDLAEAGDGFFECAACGASAMFGPDAT